MTIRYERIYNGFNGGFNEIGLLAFVDQTMLFWRGYGSPRKIPDAN